MYTMALYTVLFSTIAMVAAKDCESPLGMESGAIPDSLVKASSQEDAIHQAFFARLNRNDGGGGWKAASPEEDPDPYLIVDLGAKADISGVATQGISSGEYVTEYKLHYSNDADTWTSYQTLEGNSDSNSVQRNDMTSFAARYIRFSPTDFKTAAAMRVEIYGCFSDTNNATFTGNSYITWDLDDDPINEEDPTISLRLKTIVADGLIIAGSGIQGDYIALQLMDGAIVLNINLGSSSVEAGDTTIKAGGLMDDNMWHSITIVLNKGTVELTVDRQTITTDLNGNFKVLNLDRNIMFGGTDNFDFKYGISVKENFVGCLEDLQFDGTDIIKSMQDQEKEFTLTGDSLSYECNPIEEVPITFPTEESYLLIKGPTLNNFSMSFEFRSFNEEGLLVNNSFDNGYIEVGLRDGKLSVYTLLDDETPFPLDSAVMLNDGQWHSISINIEHGVGGKLVIDDFSPVKVDYPSLSFAAISEDYYIGAYPLADGLFNGGEIPYIPGFLGCVKNLKIGDKKINLEDDDSFDQNEGVVINTCGLTDRCIPNPCENGGTCQQDYDSFDCSCTNTGYTGSTCHMSLSKRSCEDIAERGLSTGIHYIDPDGSGPLGYFSVYCEIDDTTKEAITTVKHNSEDPENVQGFVNPGSYMRDVVYQWQTDETSIDIDLLVAFIDNTESCSQNIKYECTNSRLLNKGIPWGWWVGRSSMQMDYWGGSDPGTNKCACGLTQSCVDPELWCNCDAEKTTKESDEGDLTHKDDLPVTQLRFGDTGEVGSLGVHTLGQLQCQGDLLLENVATINRDDAFIRFKPQVAWGTSGDISFYFKTTAISGVMLHLTSSKDDYIIIELTDANTVKFSYSVFGMVDSLTRVSSQLLNDTAWHYVSASRNPKHATLLLDSENQVEQDSIYGDFNLELNEYIYVGAPELQIPGFVGCIRALLINGAAYDLKGEAEEFAGTQSGCVGVCESNPCLHGGQCIEMYGGFQCDCTDTAFKGLICSEEIGMDLSSSDQRLEYDFSSSDILQESHEETVRLGFQTDQKKGLLFSIYSEKDATDPGYISININDQGNVVAAWNLGQGEIVLTDPHDYADDQHHTLKFQRLQTGGNLNIDDYEQIDAVITPTDTSNSLNQLDKIYIGADESGSGSQFQGCLSRAEFIQSSEGGETFSVFPFSLAFGGGEVPEAISLLPKLDAPQESDCGVVGATLPPVTDLPPFETDLPGIINAASTDQTTGAVIAVVVILVFALILLAACIGHYAIKNRGDYVTREDEGAKTAPDADMALSQQPAVGKEKEWYI